MLLDPPMWLFFPAVVPGSRVTHVVFILDLTHTDTPYTVIVGLRSESQYLLQQIKFALFS